MEVSRAARARGVGVGGGDKGRGVETRRREVAGGGGEKTMGGRRRTMMRHSIQRMGEEISGGSKDSANG